MLVTYGRFDGMGIYCVVHVRCLSYTIINLCKYDAIFIYSTDPSIQLSSIAPTPTNTPTTTPTISSTAVPSITPSLTSSTVSGRGAQNLYFTISTNFILLLLLTL